MTTGMTRMRGMSDRRLLLFDIDGTVIASGEVPANGPCAMR